MYHVKTFLYSFLAQVETETLREELKFKEHRIEELEGVAKREKEHSSAQEGEMQSLLEKLAHEVETNTRLSHELQEGHSGKEVKVVHDMYAMCIGLK